MMSGAAWNWMALWAVAIVLGTHALLGFSAFPVADDFSFAPLAEIWADPGLYSRDDLLHGIANHARAYNAVYWLAESAIGIAAGFWAAVVALSVASVMALRAIMVRVGGAGVALPLAVTAAMERRAEAGLTGAGWGSPAALGATVAAGAVGLAILALNTTPPGWFFALSGILLISAPGRAVPKVALAVMLVAVFGWTAYQINLRPRSSANVPNRSNGPRAQPAVTRSSSCRRGCTTSGCWRGAASMWISGCSRSPIPA